ncbi:MAG: DUF4446 family protein [Candidatus Taylorbacteria bacterium]
MLTTFITNPAYIAIVVLAIISITLLILVIDMRIKLRKFLVNIDATNIADSLTIVADSTRDLKAFQKEMEGYLSGVEKRLRKSVQSVHTVRFNPFHGTGGGGNQSFATAFVNEEGDGVVLSSLYSRESTNVYSKPIKKYSSEHELSAEEKEAIEKARLAMN